MTSSFNKDARHDRAALAGKSKSVSVQELRSGERPDVLTARRPGVQSSTPQCANDSRSVCRYGLRKVRREDDAGIIRGANKIS
jgi:hypothetical protein